MYSQCPGCLARFRVTAARLRAGRGRARCGRCGQPFDLFERLSDQLPALPGDPSQPPPAPEPSSPASLADAEAELASVVEQNDHAGGGTSDAGDYHFSAEDIEKVFIDARDWQKQHGGAAATAPADDAAVEGAAAEGAELVVDEPEGVEDITLEGAKVEIDNGTGESMRLEAQFDLDEDEVDEDGGDDEDEDIENEDDEDLDSTSQLRTLENVPESAYPVDDEDDPAPTRVTDEETAFFRALMEGRELPDSSQHVADRVRADRTSAGRGAAAAPPIRAELRAVPPNRWGETRRAGVSEDDLAELDLAAPAPRPRPGNRWLALGSVLLAITLAAQIVHHFRQEIVRHPRAGPILARVYAWIGAPLSPNWNLDAFELSQWGPTEDLKPGAALTVRASLTNRAGHAQPYPLLRLEFENRFGAAVAQRDFLPGEYLKSASQAARQLAAGEATEAELSVIAPGTDAVGYRLDICMREATGRVRCAHGAG